MPDFIPGLKLSRLFFTDAVLPILGRVDPEIKYAAALIGSGSEVLGFDDEMSTDHHWGPRVMLFTDQGGHGELDRALRNQLPTEFLGYPTNFRDPDPNDNNVQQLVAIESGPVNHRVEMFTIRDYLLAYLNFDINQEIEPADWLTFPEQKLRSITAGAVFHDEIGLQEILDGFRYYPDDVWLYLLASGWNRISQEEHLMGRAGYAGDEIGSALIASRLVRDVMRLCFLMERVYAPYPKWFGTAFRRLSCAKTIAPHLEGVMLSTTWREREANFVLAYEIIAEMHTELRITEPLQTKAAKFFGRPFKVIEHIGGFAEAIRAQINDPTVRRLETIGSIDQFSDNTDLLSGAKWRRALRRLYE